MKEYKLTKEDYEQIKKIIEITTSIDTIYIELYKLEVSNKKDTDEYKKVLEILKKEIALENKLYEEYKVSNTNKCLACAKYLITEKVPKDFPNNTESLMTQSYNNRIIRRILNVLSNQVNSDYHRIKSVIPEELKEMLTAIGEENPDKVINDSIRSSVAITDAFENDLFNTFLSILKETLESKDYHYYTKELISSKYNLSYINKTIEKSMVSNNFDISDTLYITSKFISDMYNVIDDAYEVMKDSYYERIAAEQLSEILEIGDMDYSNPSKVVSSILRQDLMRSAFSLMSDDALEEHNYTFHEYIESKSFLERHQYDKISIQLIINCFNSIKRDKTKHHTLYLGRK